MYKTVEHIHKNAPPRILELNLTNAEKFNLGKSAPLAQKQITLFNKLCLVHILLILKLWSQFLMKNNFRCHPEYPSQGQLISVYSGKVLDSCHGFHIQSLFSTSILFLFSSPFSSVTTPSKAPGCYIGEWLSHVTGVQCAVFYRSLFTSLASAHHELPIVIPQILS